MKIAAIQTIIQVIETQWTKKSRGAPGARLRNAVPEVFALPDPPGPACAAWFHAVYCDEHRGFIPQFDHDGLICFSSHLAKKYQLSVSPQAGQVDVQFFGPPQALTSGRPKNTHFLRPNQWLQIVANRRTPQEWGWVYNKYVYNILFCQPRSANTLLSCTPPVLRIQHEKQLR